MSPTSWNPSHEVPAPVPDDDTHPFWAGTAEHRLLVPRCAACGLSIWQPQPICPRCHSTDVRWEETTGSARLVSWIVLHPPVLPAFERFVDCAVILVELEDPPVRMVGNLADGDGNVRPPRTIGPELVQGMPLSLVWRRQGEFTLPAWTPV